MDILLPNAVVAEGGRLHEIITVDGRQFDVVPVGDTATRIKVFDASGFPPVLRSIRKDSIQSISPTGRSAMPATYGEQYTVKEILDIIAFIKAAGSDTPQPVNLSDLF